MNKLSFSYEKMVEPKLIQPSLGIFLNLIFTKPT